LMVVAGSRAVDHRRDRGAQPASRARGPRDRVPAAAARRGRRTRAGAKGARKGPGGARDCPGATASVSDPRRGSARTGRDPHVGATRRRASGGGGKYRSPCRGSRSAAGGRRRRPQSEGGISAATALRDDVRRPADREREAISGRRAPASRGSRDRLCRRLRRSHRDSARSAMGRRCRCTRASR
jgi:hypothetical protein